MVGEMTKNQPLRALALALVLAAGAGTVGVAQASTPLAEDEHVTRSLLAAAVGDKIRRECPTISARIFAALQEASELRRYALSKGHSEGEIEAFLDDRAQEERLRRLRDAYLAENGAREGDAESYCRLGRDEIARNSLTGRLLRAD
jgi:hypothetical protein